MIVLSFGLLAQTGTGHAQINTSGCSLADFGINAVLYSNTTFSTGTPLPPSGTVDWFKATGGTGRNVIDQTNASTIQTLLQGTWNPEYEARMNGSIFSKADIVSGTQYRKMIDAVWARDKFGGAGATDPTAFVVSSKNGDDPAVWYPGEGKVLGKNDLVDIAAHMFRNVNGSTSTNDLWFTGLINRAEPGGEAYMDFEFYIENVALYNPTPTTLKFTSGGPDMGHTAFRFNATTGAITRLGDVLYNLSLQSGGTTPNLEVRIWMSRTDYNAFRASPPARTAQRRRLRSRSSRRSSRVPASTGMATGALSSSRALVASPVSRPWIRSSFRCLASGSGRWP